MNTTSLQDVVTQNEQEALAYVRDWRTYLHARLILLEQHDARSDGNTFEQETASDLAEAERDLAGLEPGRRTLFERAEAQRREQERLHMEDDLRRSANGVHRLVDPDELDRLTLRSLLDEAQHPDESGHVLFPAGDATQVEWLELRASALTELPDPRAFRATHRLRLERDRLLRIAGGIAALLLTLAALWMLLAPGGDGDGAAGAPVATANDLPLIAWPVSSITLVGESITTLRLASVAGSWPTDGQAYARAVGALPLELCAPGDALDSLNEIRIAGDGSIPERVYTVSFDGGATDLEIVPCDDEHADRRAHATLQRLAPVPVAEVGIALALNAHTITLAAVTVTGPAESPEVPQGAARVSIMLSAGGALEWTALAPTLRLGDGTQQTAPELRSAPDGGTELRFLVNAPRETLPAEFRLTDPATRQIARWRIAVAPPIDRLRLLAGTLRIDGLTGGDGRDLAVIVTNIGAQPLTLTPADFTIEAGGARTAPAAISGIDAALTSSETRTLTLSLPELRGTATLTIGTAMYQVNQ